LKRGGRGRGEKKEGERQKGSSSKAKPEASLIPLFRRTLQRSPQIFPDHLRKEEEKGGGKKRRRR